jgi:hypothetical protein
VGPHLRAPPSWQHPLPISGHNAVWKTDRNPPLTGHFPDRRRPDRSGLDTSRKAVWGALAWRRFYETTVRLCGSRSLLCLQNYVLEHSCGGSL